MAVVGQLLVELSANVARLRTDMERASGLVESHTKRMAKAASVATGALGAIGVGVSVGAVATQFMRAVESIDAFNDASDRTGASVEELSSLVNTLAPFGHGLDVISTASERLIKSMSAAEDETKGAGAAFKALGVDTREANGSLRPSQEVLDDVAKSLAQYKDGSNKTALAVEIFGKQGAELIPMLKDLAEAQRVAGTVSTEQANEADKLSRSLNSLRAMGVQLGQSIAASLVPKINDMIEQFRVGREAAGGFFGALARFGLATGSPEENIDRLRKEIDALNVSIAAGEAGLQKEGPVYGARFAERVEADRKAVAKAIADLQYFRLLQRQSGAPETNMRASSMYDADITLPDAPGGGRGAGDAAKAARDALEAYKEFSAFIDQKDIDYTLKQEAEAAKELATQLERAATAALSRIAANDRAEQDADEGIRRDVEAIKDAIDPTRALYRELERVRELTSAGLLPTDAGNARMMQVYGQIDQILVNIPERAAEAKDAMQGMLAPIESAFESAIIRGEKLSDVLSSLAQDFARLMLRQQITGPLSDFLSGGLDPAKQSGTIFGQILSGITGSGGGPELLNKSAGAMAPSAATKSAGSIVVNQTITYGSGGGRAEAFAFGQTVKADTIRAIRESEARGA